jgi:hypothetical protein
MWRIYYHPDPHGSPISRLLRHTLGWGGPILTRILTGLYETGKTPQVSQEMHRYNLKILGLCETSWTGTGRTYATHIHRHHPLLRT